MGELWPNFQEAWIFISRFGSLSVGLDLSLDIKRGDLAASLSCVSEQNNSLSWWLTPPVSTNRFWCTTGCTWYIINVISYFTDVLWVNWGSNELVEVTLLCRLIWLFNVRLLGWFGNKLLNWLISDFFVCVEIWTSVVMQLEGKLLKWLKIYQTSLFWIYFSFSYFCYRSAKRKSIINEFLFFLTK